MFNQEETDPATSLFRFFDIRGGTLKQTSMVLQPGTGAFLDYRLTGGGSSPADIAPCIKVLRGVALASLEVSDIFIQRTRILINWGDRPAPQSGDVDFGLAGLRPFETMRLSAFCEADVSVMPPPCDITFAFHGSAGGLAAGCTGRPATRSPALPVERDEFATAPAFGTIAPGMWAFRT
ncbi:hypothetical protein SBA3_1350006 [Candidatus Sulfopaludibacter sp. SbA3]|nr:hypothetical protein SBA3_1350006 [Candidatus Sulfopaludibacter sp. SbA3]